MNELVSVIIPFYNAEKFLGEAIQSVLDQTYDKWELLLIDDGSTDSGTDIALEYARNEKIQYLDHPSHQNRGACVSRNAGIFRAKGKYVAFLDSDDVWFPDKLRQQIDIFDRVPEAAMVCGPALYWFSWTNRSTDRKLDILQDLGIESERLYRAPTLLLRLDPLGKADEDQAFGMKIFLKESVFVSGNSWIKYRKHVDSSTSMVNRSGRDREAHLFLLHWVEEFLDKNGANDWETRSALQRVLWPYQHPFLYRIRESMLAPLRLTKWAALKILGPDLYHHLRRKLRT